MTSAAQPVLFNSTAEKDFKRLTSSRYRSMVERFKEKRDRNNRIIRHGRIVPFSEKQYQAWVLERLGGKFDGAAKCHYQCGTWISVQTFVNDHVDPVSLGGSLGLENLCGCCEPCNSFKGKLSEKDFGALRVALKSLSPYGELEVIGRLRKAIKLAAGARWGKQKAVKTVTQKEIDDDVEF